MKIRTLFALAALGTLTAGAATSATTGCSDDMSVLQCVRQVALIAQGFQDQLRGVYAEISRKEVPVGTVVTSVLTPEQFLNEASPQYDPSSWVPADGRALPANSTYQKLTGQAYAPDLRQLAQQRMVLDVVDGTAQAGQVVDQLRTPQFASADWKFHFAARTVQGNRANNDVEQDTDQFEVLVSEGRVVAHGRTLNWKHNVWGGWSDGNTNYLGIATMRSPFHYYVKIN
ncbi:MULTISPECIES: hypothetical protein [Rhizobium/Agrobacterium group]|uniref:hypothetical protein n=1 Tax=Rhizobium/Agrobacterium group TaxID=227290 RepID=UPI00230102AD|nr:MULTISPECIES: hypothetical protein [Rhizobium/Agrobacterium group]MDA5631495.1 hypothetical protein [Agrobacterium sp. ST15.16.024]MDF1887356.1 hypothetical protein [Rhizobium rhizogenes]